MKPLQNSGTKSISNTKKRERWYYGWIVLAACLILMTVTYGIRFSFGVFFQSLEEEFSWTRALTSEVFSAYMLCSCVCALIGGWAIDHYPAKKLVIGMGCFAGLGLLLTSRASSPVYLFLSYSLLLGIGTGPTFTITAALASRWFTEKRALAFAITGSGVSLATILMAPIASFLIAGYGWRTSYLIMALIAFVVMIPTAFLLKRSPAEAPPVGAADRQEGFPILRAIKTRNFALIVLLWFLYSFCLFMVMTHVVRHAIDLGVTPIAAALTLTLLGGANMLTRIPLGMAADYFGKKRVSIVFSLLAAGAMFWLIKSTSLWMLYLFAVVFGMANAGLGIATTALVGDLFGVRHIGVIFATLEIPWATGAAVGPAVAGYIFDVNGSYSFAWLLGAIASLLIIGLLPPLKTPPERGFRRAYSR
jgi:OFA family oxalate/formate antiporter-like MFS transporter